MTPPASYESRRLQRVEHILQESVDSFGVEDRDEARIRILEAVAARFGGFDPDWYADQQSLSALDGPSADSYSDAVVDSIRSTGVHPALALAALARPPLTAAEKRRTGSFYTDYRLATFLGRLARPQPRARLVDPACGTGILLVAAALQIAASSQKEIDRALGQSIFGADRSPRALRGAALALASLTSSHAAIQGVQAHLRTFDSLVEGMAAWRDLAPDGFDLVIGNPPWEKLKLSRHEFLRANGVDRHYGHSYEEAGDLMSGFSEARAKRSAYQESLAANYSLQGGETDLFSVFSELAFRLVKEGGEVAFLLPAGLIRSQGTEKLRHFLFAKSRTVEMTVLENRARFFAIDTRTKFLALLAKTESRTGARSRPTRIRLAHGAGTDEGVRESESLEIALSDLRSLRPDLTLPEVRDEGEWRIFSSMSSAGRRVGEPDGPWNPRFFRELDMTNDRKHFERHSAEANRPVVEGRLVHQYRFGAKQFVSGSGRAARWGWVPLGQREEVRPQFYCRIDGIGEATLERSLRSRIGFCDVTGQTNERTLLACEIPAGVLCGNKVPTASFPQYRPTEERVVARCWMAIFNSIPFDWLARRVITTSANFFIIQGLPMPAVDPLAPEGRWLATTADRLSRLCEGRGRPKSRSIEWEAARLRAEIDARVAYLYGLGWTDLAVILDDFPLLDRAQTPLPGEPSSTVTRDFLLSVASGILGGDATECTRRARAARRGGAVPYVPTELGRAQQQPAGDGMCRQQRLVM